MNIITRPFRDTDWQYFLTIINQTILGWEVENRKVFDHSRNFDTFSYSRRQYVAECDGTVRAYGALEQSRERGVFRVYMPLELIETAGEKLYQQMERDFHVFPISSLWARAFSYEMEEFFVRHGFKMLISRVLPDDKTPMVTLEKTLRASE